jgi:hypothetical protein
MARNIFIDPAGNRDDYSWPINHSEEQEVGKSRNVEHGANTANTGFVRQQSDESPLTLRFSGIILEKAQIQEMIAWWQLCETQTIYLTDFAGDEYEVIVTRFVPTRHKTVRNPRDYANAPNWYWRYEIDLDVVRVIDGIWADVAP